MIKSQFAIVLTVFLLFMVTNKLQAQGSMRYVDEDIPSKWVFGGGFGMGFSTYGSSIQLAPTIGYRATPKLETGLRLLYNFYSVKQFDVRLNSHSYGGGPYVNYAIYRGLFAHAEYELLSFEGFFINNANQQIDKLDRVNISSVFVGGGYRQYFSTNAYGVFMVLYNLNESINSPYSNPVFRIGFGFGF
jgi:hypothetical protein